MFFPIVADVTVQTVHQTLVFVVLAAVIYALVYLRSSPDLVLWGGLTVLLLAGVVEPREALAGIANEGLIAVAVLFVVAEGLRQTGGINFLGQRLLGRPKSIRSALWRIMLPTAVMSAVSSGALGTASAAGTRPSASRGHSARTPAPPSRADGAVASAAPSRGAIGGSTPAAIPAASPQPTRGQPAAGTVASGVPPRTPSTTLPECGAVLI